MKFSIHIVYDDNSYLDFENWEKIKIIKFVNKNYLNAKFIVIKVYNGNSKISLEFNSHFFNWQIYGEDQNENIYRIWKPYRNIGASLNKLEKLNGGENKK